MHPGCRDHPRSTRHQAYFGPGNENRSLSADRYHLLQLEVINLREAYQSKTIGTVSEVTTPPTALDAPTACEECPKFNRGNTGRCISHT